MKLKKPLAIGGGIFAIILLLLGRGCYLVIYGYNGVAADATGLEKIFEAAGPPYAEFYTNSFLQSIPFNDPISWHRNLGERSRTMIALTSRVDVAVFKQKMAHLPFKYFFDETSPGKNSLAMFEFVYRAEGDWVVQTDGSLDLSGALKMDCRMLERKIQGDEWFHMTNNPAINFDFSEKK